MWIARIIPGTSHLAHHFQSFLLTISKVEHTVSSWLLTVLFDDTLGSNQPNSPFHTFILWKYSPSGQQSRLGTDRFQDLRDDFIHSMQLKTVAGRAFNVKDPLDAAANATAMACSMPFCAGVCDVARHSRSSFWSVQQKHVSFYHAFFSNAYIVRLSHWHSFTYQTTRS